MSIDWTQVRDFIYTLELRGPYPFPGSPEWIDADPDTRINGLIVAGSGAALDAARDELHAARHAMKEAAIEISDAREWATVAQRIRDRDAALRSGVYIRRAS